MYLQAEKIGSLVSSSWQEVPNGPNRQISAPSIRRESRLFGIVGRTLSPHDNTVILWQRTPISDRKAESEPDLVHERFLLPRLMLGGHKLPKKENRSSVDSDAGGVCIALGDPGLSVVAEQYTSDCLPEVQVWIILF